MIDSNLAVKLVELGAEVSILDAMLLFDVKYNWLINQ